MAAGLCTLQEKPFVTSLVLRIHSSRGWPRGHSTTESLQMRNRFKVVCRCFEPSQPLGVTLGLALSYDDNQEGVYIYTSGDAASRLRVPVCLSFCACARIIFMSLFQILRSDFLPLFSTSLQPRSRPSPPPSQAHCTPWIVNRPGQILFLPVGFQCSLLRACTHTCQCVCKGAVLKTKRNICLFPG